MRYSRAICLVTLLVAFLGPALAAPQPDKATAASSQPYVRVVKNRSGRPEALQTSVVVHRMPGGQRVDLVSAVHLGEASYYAGLNKRFSGYDVVLYELVVSGDGAPVTGPVVIPRDEGSDSSLSQVQMMLCRLLGLKFQLHAINYAAPNFRHADLSYAEFQAAMDRQGESTTDLLMKVLKIAISNADQLDSGELSDVEIITILARGPSPREQLALRRMFAACFPEIERLTSEIQGSTLIAGRNKRAIEVLDRELKHGARSVAVFYGAGHMPDLARRLRSRGGTVTRSEWITAWNLVDR